jgi:hypothetical protein
LLTAATVPASYANRCNWYAYLDRINPLLGFPNYSPDEETFAQAVASWQQKQRLGVDGVIGPKTWAKMQVLIGISQVPSTASYSTSSSSFKQRIKEIAEQEWEFFGRGKKKNDANFWKRVNLYFREALGRDQKNRDEAWSAAFISWVMKKAGAGNKFRYSSGHSYYITDAIKKRTVNDPDAGFKGYRPDEITLEVGDLVCNARCSKKNPNCSKADYSTTNPGYLSHCDIVVATRPGEIDIIGGNTSNRIGTKQQYTVGKKTLKVDTQGKLLPETDKFVVIKNLL